MEKVSGDWSLDDWEYIPDCKFFAAEKVGLGSGETKQVVGDPLLTEEYQVDEKPDPEDLKVFKDIGVVPAAATICDPEVPDSVKLSCRLVDPDDDNETPAFDEKQTDDSKQEDDAVHVEEKGDPAVNSDKPCLECVGFNIWKWRVSGIGALYSVGFAAAAICILFIGGGKQAQQQHKMHFQIYADDKRMKQVVQQASRLNQAMSAVRGSSSAARANISFGGYYGGL